tara:strand:- start:170 stop:625 length:456 start_codon:yes stop_codon:yes gene_type:complete
MTGYYNLLDKLKTHFDSDAIVNTITQGDIFKVDLAKQTIFPLIHIMVNSCTIDEQTTTWNVSLIAMDVVDLSKTLTTDVFLGNDNEIDVLNTQHAVLNRVYDIMKRGTLMYDLFQVEGTATLEPFTERFENYLAGWTMTIDIVTPNQMTIC